MGIGCFGMVIGNNLIVVGTWEGGGGKDFDVVECQGQLSTLLSESLRYLEDFLPSNVR